ncbi:MAG: Gfo/Idh/MocA family oxidoreductase [Pirellulales bacterium]
MNDSEPDQQSSTRVYGVGVIGAGGIFPEHARGYAQLPRTRIVALADVDAERMRRASKDFFIPVTCTDYRQLLAREDVDIVDVCTPPNLHEEMVIAALEAGKFVLCEKPIAHSLAAADRIIAAADRHPGKLSIIYQLRYLPEARRIVWLRDRGMLGEPKFARMSRYGALPGGRSKAWWGRWEVAGGGALMTQCIHEIDMMLQLFGPVARVTASMATLGNPIESEDTFSATVEMQSGAVVSCYCTLAGQMNYGNNWDIVCGKGSVHYPWNIQSLDRGLRSAALKESLKQFPSTGKRPLLPGLPGKVLAKVMRKLGIGKRSDPSRHKAYFVAFLDAIESGADVPVSPRDARQSLEVCTAIYTAAITGQPVTLPLAADCRFYNGITAADYDGRRQGVPA